MAARLGSLIKWTGLVLVLLWGVSVAMPQILRGGERLRAWLGPETTGLVFVESPEVYTRQRLVNDRYQQDAWLRGKLAEIDALDSRFVDTLTATRSDAGASVAPMGSGDRTGLGANASPLELPQIDALPFDEKFALQSAVRDKIRQLILENALDDRHDLSGNTVFGLKFDTAVIPGHKTYRSPAVVVQMVTDPLRTIRNERSPSEMAAYIAGLARYYVDAEGVDAPDPATATSDQRRDQQIVQTMGQHFEAWSGNLERRLNSHKDDYVPACPEGASAIDLATPLPLCSLERGGESDAPEIDLRPAAEDALGSLLAQADFIDEALKFELRLPARDVDVGGDFQTLLREDAADKCRALAPPLLDPERSANEERLDAISARLTDPKLIEAPLPNFLIGSTDDLRETGNVPRSIQGFLEERTQLRNRYRLASPWGQLFDLYVSLREPPSDACYAGIDVALEDKNISVLIVDGGQDEATDALSRAGWQPLPCGAAACGPGGKTVLVDIPGGWDGTLDETAEVLDDRTITALLETLDARPESAQAGELCVARYSPSGNWFFFGRNVPDERYVSESLCFAGDSFNFRLGAYRFLQRMAQVESYTYAAFPRGDVSGVVTETSSRSRVDAQFPLFSALSAAIGADEATRTRSVEAEPSIVNFASAPGEAFDFGWSIVKEGPKSPMLASQLVLVSVPAYLREIELNIWRGFLDIDEARLEDAGANALAEPLAQFMSAEPQNITLQIPPDYTALDGIVIGTRLVSGPRIRQKVVEDQCFYVTPGGSFAIAIPGARLWRSTLVTIDGLKADRIEVMPDMQGILATFDAQAADAADDGAPLMQRAELSPGTHNLVVWTSEGNAPTTIKLLNIDDGSSDCEDR